jgi:ABC-type transport system involved in cytochrome c biogenesis permease subunit
MAIWCEIAGCSFAALALALLAYGRQSGTGLLLWTGFFTTCAGWVLACRALGLFLRDRKAGEHSAGMWVMLAVGVLALATYVLAFTSVHSAEPGDDTFLPKVEREK